MCFFEKGINSSIEVITQKLTCYDNPGGNNAEYNNAVGVNKLFKSTI